MRRLLGAAGGGLLLAALAAFLLAYLQHAQTARGVRGGFGFLEQAAGFRMAEGLFAVAPEQSYGLALVAGLVNTLTVAAIALPCATLLGGVLGLMRLSRHPLLARAGALAVEPLRNTPVLLQLFVWYGLLLNLPDVRHAWTPLPGVLLSNRGLALPAPHGAWPYAAALAAWASAAWTLRRGSAGAGKPRTGKPGGAPARAAGARRWSILAALALALLAWLWLEAPAATLDLPRRQGFGLRGGWQISVEFAALILGLAVFHAAYIADIMRGAVRAVPLGLVEAGQALALTPGRLWRRVILPNAARAGLPPYANQCLAVIKNSTLAIAIGYQDLMAVINTAITQTGLALEGMTLATGIYLALAMSLGAGLAAWNRRLSRQDAGSFHGPRWGARLPSSRLAAAALWGTPARVVVTLLTSGLLGWLAWRLSSWGLLDAIWRDPTACAADGAGACWAAVRLNFPLLVYGTMPAADRPAATVAIVALAAGVWSGALAGGWPWRARLYAAGLAGVVALSALAGWPWGHALPVPRWNGLLATLLLAVAALLLALPLAMLLALARRARRALLAWPAALVIEAARGVPLPAQLLFASFVLPLLFDGGIAKFWMALAALALHTACLLAEVLRGALQAVPAGQLSAARALGMTTASAYWHVVWPQARRIGTPAALGVFVGAVKDTSLVGIIGVFDLLGAAKAVVADTVWRPYHVELYASVALFYFCVCALLSRAARRAEAGAA
ncbi:ABC transporter permease subunit [Bordetella genomosp. 10]|uniref:ABC transporter permease subunit n=1 Tax=Bordetella genomosp. 10 TaxID=1416804 RepID=UPI000B9E0C79|nr:ABC transporter permease subunit [Bordetella genomosp. 10]